MGDPKEPDDTNATSARGSKLAFAKPMGDPKRPDGGRRATSARGSKLASPSPWVIPKGQMIPTQRLLAAASWLSPSPWVIPKGQNTVVV
jgi:hypothetical protein